VESEFLALLDLFLGQALDHGELVLSPVVVVHTLYDSRNTRCLRIEPRLEIQPDFIQKRLQNKELFQVLGLVLIQLPYYFFFAFAFFLKHLVLQVSKPPVFFLHTVHSFLAKSQRFRAKTYFYYTINLCKLQYNFVYSLNYFLFTI